LINFHHHNSFIGTISGKLLKIPPRFKHVAVPIFTSQFRLSMWST